MKMIVKFHLMSYRLYQILKSVATIENGDGEFVIETHMGLQHSKTILRPESGFSRPGFQIQYLNINSINW